MYTLPVSWEHLVQEVLCALNLFLQLQKQHKRSIQEVQKLLELSYENEKQALQEKDHTR